MLPAGVVRAADAAEAARLAVELARARAGAGPSGDRHPGTILLTVGSKTVATYARVAREAGVRVVARVLPTPEALAACADAGLEPRDVVAMQGPTSAGLDAALLRHLGATVLVTKDSGDAGGVARSCAPPGWPARRRSSSSGRPPRPPRRPPRSPGRPPPRAGPDGGGQYPGGGARMAPRPGRHRGRRSARGAGRLAAPGLLQVYTGDGKGKTTAAAGLALRASGAGLSVVFVQFVKGGTESSELAPLRAAGVDVVRPAVARSGLLRGAATQEDRAAAAAAWAAARAALTDPDCDLVVLDELHAAAAAPARRAARGPHRPRRPPGAPGGRHHRPRCSGGAARHGRPRHRDEPVRHPYPDVPARRGIEL